MKKRHFANFAPQSRRGFFNLSNFNRCLKTVSIAAIAMPISLALASTARSQNATSLNVTFVNNTNSELTSLQVAPPNTRNWGANLLASPTTNDAVDVVIADDRSECNYDVRATFANGSTNEDFDINFCKYDVYTFASVPALW